LFSLAFVLFDFYGTFQGLSAFLFMIEGRLVTGFFPLLALLLKVFKHFSGIISNLAAVYLAL